MGLPNSTVAIKNCHPQRTLLCLPACEKFIFVRYSSTTWWRHTQILEIISTKESNHPYGMYRFGTQRKAKLAIKLTGILGFGRMKLLKSVITMSIVTRRQLDTNCEFGSFAVGRHICRFAARWPASHRPWAKFTSQLSLNTVLTNYSLRLFLWVYMHLTSRSFVEPSFSLLPVHFCKQPISSSSFFVAIMLSSDYKCSLFCRPVYIITVKKT
jgi:hypothetical protein